MSAPTATPPLKTEAQPDRNYLSLEANGQTWYAGTPDAMPAVAPEDGMLLEPANPKDWDSVLKCSGRRNTHLVGLTVSQGRENTLDCNSETASCSFRGEWGLQGREGQQVFTVKGGSHHLAIAGEVWSRGTRADLAVGLWSDQSTAVSHDLDFTGLTLSSARLFRGEPLTVILCRVNQPWKAWLLGKAPDDIQLPEGAQVLRLASLGAQIHWVGKLAGVKLGLIKGRKD